MAQALWGLSRKAIKNALSGIIGAAVIVLYLLGVNVIVLLMLGGVAMLLNEMIRRRKAGQPVGAFLPFIGSSLPVMAVTSFSLTTLFLTFLKIGAVLYGSGYVLLAFLRADFVSGLG